MLLSGCIRTFFCFSSESLRIYRHHSSFLMGYISTHGLLAQLGLFIGRGTLCSLIIVLFVLPGLLYLFDGLIAKTTLHSDFYRER